MEGITAGLAIWLIILSRTDIRQRRLPNALTVPAALAAIASGCADSAVASAVIATTGLYLCVAFADGCGGGDVKLACALGGMAGDIGTAIALVLVAQLITMIQLVLTRRRTAAHGPALAAAATLTCGPWAT